MIFGSGYQAPPPGPSHLDRTMGGFTIGEDQIAIEGTASARQVIGTADLGMSVTEGSRFGSLVQTATEAIRTGTGSIELATIQGGGEPGGAESYGWEARRALRELAKANNVYFSSVHTPSNTVGNLSGYNYQEKGFNDELRHRSLEEVKKAIIFAADVGAGAVVGLLTFSRVLKWLFTNFKNYTLAILTGFIIGSLNKIWPWKETLTWRTNSHGIDVPLNQKSVSPFHFEDNQLLYAIVLAIVGFGLILLLEKLAVKKD